MPRDTSEDDKKVFVRIVPDLPDQFPSHFSAKAEDVARSLLARGEVTITLWRSKREVDRDAFYVCYEFMIPAIARAARASNQLRAYTAMFDKYRIWIDQVDNNSLPPDLVEVEA